MTAETIDETLMYLDGRDDWLCEKAAEDIRALRSALTARDEEVTEMWLQVAAAVGVSPGTTLAESINCIDSMRDRLTARDEAFETILRVAEYMPEGHHKESIRNTINAVRAR